MIDCFEDLLGKRLASVEGYVGGEVMTFTLETGEVYQLHHYQNCCESVTIEDINGDRIVNLADFVLLAIDWQCIFDVDIGFDLCLDDSYFPQLRGFYPRADVDKTLSIDFNDARAVAENWLNID